MYRVIAQHLCGRVSTRWIRTGIVQVTPHLRTARRNFQGSSRIPICLKRHCQGFNHPPSGRATLKVSLISPSARLCRCLLSPFLSTSPIFCFGRSLLSVSSLVSSVFFVSPQLGVPLIITSCRLELFKIVRRRRTLLSSILPTPCLLVASYSHSFFTIIGSREQQLASNNPFRRAVSPAVPSPTSPFLDPVPSSNNGRPVSRNPFLDPANDRPAEGSNNDLLISIDDMSTNSKGASTSIDDIFNSLSVDNKPMSPLTNPAAVGSAVSGDSRPPRLVGAPPPGSGRGRGAPPPRRGKNMPPQVSGNHRPSHSQETSGKSRQGSGTRELGVGGSSADASRRPSHSRPRRNSESSIAPTDSASKSAARDVRKREQSDRERSGSARPRRRNDIIDQMDASSIFGTVFHHDGPFDALNAHRNRKGSRRAPMQAFPKDSLNNSLGGSGPLNARPDHRTFMGQGEDEAFQEFSGRQVVPQSTDKLPAVPRVGVFDPLQRSSVLHGDQSLGLGTSTFLEGTPATRTAIQRREVEKEKDVLENPLQRKKSLAQRFRSINRAPRDPNAARAFSSDGGPGPSQSANGRYNTEASPSDEFDTKRGEDILSVRRKNSSGFQSPPSPPRGAPLERRSTTDGMDESTPVKIPSSRPPIPVETSQPKPSGGLLSRVKSLKGGRRPAPPPPPPIVKDS
ncbi:pal1 cell morphology protein [Ophiostoma piceae UAMH 11346]|uniref:Pal1 cell morphology protein n=1 Tax=Ophiostoma piceae (strain UAMH 11346) TaxID=1262450 RepID=S3BNI0_OPHP1|nr:pal1 cell morphology protein [Ophiostoma piceae UAMH 11346]